jgi:hypothetical protein
MPIGHLKTGVQPHLPSKATFRHVVNATKGDCAVMPKWSRKTNIYKVVENIMLPDVRSQLPT